MLFGRHIIGAKHLELCAAVYLVSYLLLFITAEAVYVLLGEGGTLAQLGCIF